MGVMAAALVGLSLVLDVLFEEFPGRIPPVSVFGRFVEPFDGSWAIPVMVGTLQVRWRAIRWLSTGWGRGFKQKNAAEKQEVEADVR